MSAGQTKGISLCLSTPPRYRTNDNESISYKKMTFIFIIIFILLLLKVKGIVKYYSFHFQKAGLSCPKKNPSTKNGLTFWSDRF